MREVLINSYLLLLSLIPFSLFAVDNKHVLFQMIPEYKNVNSNHPFKILLYFQPQPGWHIYWKNPGDVGKPPTISWQLGDNIRLVGKMKWPTPVTIRLNSIVSYGYDTQGVFVQEVQLVDKVSTNKPKKYMIKTHIEWLECKEVCLFAQAVLSHVIYSQNTATANHRFNALWNTLSITHPKKNSRWKPQGILHDGHLILQAPNYMAEKIFFYIDNPRTLTHYTLEHRGDMVYFRWLLRRDTTFTDIRGVLVYNQEEQNIFSKSFLVDIPVHSDGQNDMLFPLGVIMVSIFGIVMLYWLIVSLFHKEAMDK